MCGGRYEPVLTTQRFCAPACRHTYWRLRNAKARELLDLLDELPPGYGFVSGYVPTQEETSNEAT
jgi:hypothetical protein